MKLLLDENIDIAPRHEIVGHEVVTIAFMKWQGIKNGALLARAASEGFDALITTDVAIPAQQNISTQPISIIVLRAPSNRLADLKPLIPKLLQELNHLAPRTAIDISA